MRIGGNSTPDRAADLLSAAPPGDTDAPPDWYELEGLSRPYPCGTWHWWNQETDARAAFRCRRWSCPACAWRKARSWLELISWAAVERHVVITRLAPDPQEAHARLRNIIKAIRRGEAVEPDRHGRRRPRTFEYLATMERHSTAGIHTHLLQNGDYLHHPSLSAMLDRYGAGRVTWVERLAGDTDALARYVTRHLIAWNHPYQPKLRRRLTYSRHFWGAGSPVELRKALYPTLGTWLLVKAPPEAPLNLVRRAH